MAEIAVADIQKLLRNNGYYVTVSKTANGCLIKTPSAKLLKRKAYIIEVVIVKEENNSGVKIIIDGKEDFFEIEHDSVLLLLQMYITRVCDDINFAVELVEYYDDDCLVSEKEFFNLF